VTYEATHHGPLLDKPALFAEIGPIEDSIGDATAESFADAIIGTLQNTDFEFDKVALGIGGLHYSDKFSRLALSGKYIFSHIMPKYYANEYDMIEKAFEKSELKNDIAVIDWKGIKAEFRDNIIKKLNVLGIDYEKV
jgi:D-aminoacyl-tRNA deacylase